MEIKMNAGKITAKLRDAVPVCFIAGGEEVKRYKNIEIPDSLKDLEITNFGFDVTGEKIPSACTSRTAYCRQSFLPLESGR
jgi:hypothetical protein